LSVWMVVGTMLAPKVVGDAMLDVEFVSQLAFRRTVVVPNPVPSL
jgi:hypothetical protein